MMSGFTQRQLWSNPEMKMSTNSIAAFMLLTSDRRNGQLQYGMQTV